MFTVPQADILELLRDFKYLRDWHVKKYIKTRHNMKSEHIAIMLKQLRVMGKIMMKEGYIFLPGREINNKLLMAFDVMMELTNGNVDLICQGIKPFTLLFAVKEADNKNETGKQQQYNHFGVVIVEPYCENYICSLLQLIDPFQTVIFILSNAEQQLPLQIKNKSYYAVQSENGWYKFYKSVNNQQNN